MSSYHDTGNTMSATGLGRRRRHRRVGGARRRHVVRRGGGFWDSVGDFMKKTKIGSTIGDMIHPAVGGIVRAIGYGRRRRCAKRRGCGQYAGRKRVHRRRGRGWGDTYCADIPTMLERRRAMTSTGGRKRRVRRRCGRGLLM